MIGFALQSYEIQTLTPKITNNPLKCDENVSFNVMIRKIILHTKVITKYSIKYSEGDTVAIAIPLYNHNINAIITQIKYQNTVTNT